MRKQIKQCKIKRFTDDGANCNPCKKIVTYRLIDLTQRALDYLKYRLSKFQLNSVSKVKAVARANKVCCLEPPKVNIRRTVSSYQQQKVEATNMKIEEYLNITKKDILDSLILQYVKYRYDYPQLFELFANLIDKLNNQKIQKRIDEDNLKLNKDKTTLDEDIEKLDSMKRISESRLKSSSRKTKEYFKPIKEINSREIDIFQNQLKKLHKEQQDTVIFIQKIAESKKEMRLKIERKIIKANENKRQILYDTQVRSYKNIVYITLGR